MSMCNRSLVLVTIAFPVACLIGCAKPEEPLTEGQRVVAIERRDGKVRKDTSQPEQPTYYVMISRMQDPDECLKWVRGWTTLTKLQVDQNGTTDAGLENLKGLTSLRQLMLYDIRITDAGLRN